MSDITWNSLSSLVEIVFVYNNGYLYYWGGNSYLFEATSLT